MQIGSLTLENNVILAPMAGITDRPFRQICREFGASMAFSEMISSIPGMRNHRRTRLKADQRGESEPRAIQLLGAEPKHMAETARFCVDQGAQIIDINMGCPAKKVCSTAAGSALLKDERLVQNILEAVITAVDIPVTLKIRTGWDRENRNAVTIAHIAETSGIAALTIHGRSRACRFSGNAEYETIRRVKQVCNIPVIANGDIDCAEKAKFVLHFTGADAVMIGRAAQGKPWIFNDINHYLKHGKKPAPPAIHEVQTVLQKHLEELYCFYGDLMGVKIARKHIGWYLNHIGPIPDTVKQQINRASTPLQQIALVNSAFKTITRNRAA